MEEIRQILFETLSRISDSALFALVAGLLGFFAVLAFFPLRRMVFRRRHRPGPWPAGTGRPCRRARAGQAAASVAALVLVGILAVSLAPQPPHIVQATNAQDLPQRISGRAEVIDGDTIRISGEKIRLAGMDAPERDQTAQHRGRIVNQGTMATLALVEKIDGRNVQVKIHERGYYGRLIGTVYRGGRDIGREMVRDGFAWAEYGNQYKAEERQARRAQRGIWAHEDPIRPKQWRRAKSN